MLQQRLQQMNMPHMQPRPMQQPQGQQYPNQGQMFGHSQSLQGGQMHQQMPMGRAGMGIPQQASLQQPGQQQAPQQPGGTGMGTGTGGMDLFM